MPTKADIDYMRPRSVDMARILKETGSFIITRKTKVKARDLASPQFFLHATV